MEEVKYRQILEELSDDSKYYGDYGKQFLSNSDIGTLLSNPKGFFEPREDTASMLYGRAFHDLVMFGKTKHDNVVDASSRKTNKYRDAEEEAGQMLFLKKEWEEVNALVDSAMSNDLFKSMIQDKSNQFEQPNVSSIESDDIIWKCKADIVNEDYIIDIKTSSKIGGFKYSSKAFNYDSQAYIYSKMFQKPMKFLVVDKGTGCVGLFDVTDEAYDNGRDKVLRAEQNYLDYFVYKNKEIKNFTIYGEI